MSDPGGPSTQQHAASGAEEPEPEIPLGIIYVAVAVMLILVAATGFMLTRHGSAEASQDYPDQWDSRIAPYAKIAEKQRGLMFLHPVTVTFLPVAAFEKSVTSDKSELSTEDRSDLENFTGLMRALGLVTGDLDLFDSMNEANSGGILAYYSFEDRSITIRGQRLTPAVRSTLVHELTHALQDQHFSVADRLQELDKSSKDSPDTSESSVLDAIVEGDAERVQTLYRESLSDKQRKALDADQKEAGGKAHKRLKQVPKFLITMLTSPYTLGQTLVQAAAAEDGNAGVDDLLRDPPTEETALLDPFTVLADQSATTTPDPLDVPKLKDGEKEFVSGELGVLTWYLMLAERLPLVDALAAADGWGADAYVAYEDADGDSCARLAYTGATGRDTSRMYAALKRWAAAAPGSPAEVGRTGRRILVQSCDPGSAAKGGKDVSQEAISFVATRSYYAINFMKAGTERDVARCVAGRLFTTYPFSALSDPQFGAGVPAVQARVRAIAAACR